MDGWIMGAVANGAGMVVFLALAAMVARGLWQGGTRADPLAVAVAAFFLAAGLSHAATLLALLGPWGNAGVAASRATFGSPGLWAFDALLAGAGLLYLALRIRAPAPPGVLYEDAARRHQQALDLHDNVVQALSEAKLAIELGRSEQGVAAIDGALVRVRHMVHGLLAGEDGPRVAAGRLRREAPAERRP